ncbi:hypothetical protein TRFO_06014 [Tritrichomonas foetus]|uniref:Uncharacterized protein n=1 Tax=Tritrichomonas foetus TaxID=1144522 RepID=A0A1J4K0Y2_9EUKA|nr:hypothetical protein TRFO_06014 [Tritrichomonas foetus]|eukprot:OHT05039.1 hypothetical protein TRFO_06014 [Tritrichomonas foetus]
MNDHLPETFQNEFHQIMIDQRATELSDFLVNNFQYQVDDLNSLLSDFPSLERLGGLVASFLHSLVDVSISPESYEDLILAIRIMISESNKIKQASVQSYMSLDNIKSMTSLQNLDASLQNLSSNAPLSPRTTIDRQKLHNLEAKVQDLTIKNIDLAKENQEKSNENNKLFLEKEQLIEKNKERINRRDAEITKLQNIITDLKDQIDQQKEKQQFSNLYKENDQLAIDGLNQQIDDLTKHVDELKENILKKKNKILDLNSNYKKSMVELEGSKLTIEKLNAEIEILSQNKNDKMVENLNDFINKLTIILSEKELKSLNLAQDRKIACKLAKQLLSLNEELEDRLKMAEEDKFAHLSQIKDLNTQIKKILQENEEINKLYNTTKNEYKLFAEKVRRLETELEIDITNDQIEKILEKITKLKQSQISNATPQNEGNQSDITINPDSIRDLHKVICALCNYIYQLLNGSEDDVLPLICQSEPIFKDEYLKLTIIDSIESIMAQIPQPRLEGELEGQNEPTLLDRIFGSAESINQIIDEFAQDEKTVEYAAVAALCSANSNLRSMMESTAQQLSDLHSMLPNDYRRGDVIDSIGLFLHDTQDIFHSIFEVIQSSKYFNSTEIQFRPLMIEFIDRVGKIICDLDNEIRPAINYHGPFDGLPIATVNFITNLKEENNTISAIHAGSNFEGNYLENSIDIQISTMQEIENTKREQELIIDRLEEEKQLLQKQLDEEINELNELQVDYNMQKSKIDGLMSDYEKLLKEKKYYQELAEKRKKRFDERKQAIIKNEKEIYEDRIKRINAKFTIEKNSYNKDISNLHIRVKKLKESYINLQKLYDERIENQDITIRELIDKIKHSEESFKKQFAEKDSLHKEEIEKLEEISKKEIQNAINSSPIKSITTNTNMNTSVITFSTPKTPKTPSTPFTPVTPSNISLTPVTPGRTPDGDRFLAQLGRVLSKYYPFAEIGINLWTRSMVLSSLSTVIKKVNELDPKANHSSVTPTKSTNNTNNSSNTSNCVVQGTLKETRAWQAWANNIALHSKLVNVTNADDLRTAISDIVLGTTARTHLVRSMQSLRAQKKILVAFANDVPAVTKSEKKHEVTLNDIQFTIRCTLALRKMRTKPSRASLPRGTIKPANFH